MIIIYNNSPKIGEPGTPKHKAFRKPRWRAIWSKHVGLLNDVANINKAFKVFPSSFFFFFNLFSLFYVLECLVPLSLPPHMFPCFPRAPNTLLYFFIYIGHIEQPAITLFFNNLFLFLAPKHRLCNFSKVAFSNLNRTFGIYCSHHDLCIMYKLTVTYTLKMENCRFYIKMGLLM